MHLAKLYIAEEELGATLQATAGKSMLDQDDGEGIISRSEVRDFPEGRAPALYCWLDHRLAPAAR